MCGVSAGNGRSFFDSAVSRLCVKKGKNMKIEYNSAPLTSILGTGLDKAFREQLPDKISAVCSKKVKLLQFYTVFYGDDGNYLFEKDGVYYYPLTVVYYGDSWETRWISWTVDMSANQREPEHFGIKNIYPESVPFALFYDDGIEINVCKDEEIDEKFKAMIQGKNLYYNHRGHLWTVIYTGGFMQYMNKVSQFFMDALTLQIEVQLDEIVGETIPKRDFFLDVSVCVLDRDYIVYGDIKYLAVGFIINGHSITLSVCWEGEYDITDDIERDEVKFELCEWHPTQIVSDFDGIREFVYEYCPKLRPAE